MEYLPGLPDDVIGVMWHDERSDHQTFAALAPSARDQLAGRHDVRLCARYADGTKAKSTRIALDDLTRGMGAWRDFDRIAIITDEASVRHAVQFFGPFFHGPIRVFRNAQGAEARAWLRERK